MQALSLGRRKDGEVANGELHVLLLQPDGGGLHISPSIGLMSISSTTQESETSHTGSVSLTMSTALMNQLSGKSTPSQDRVKVGPGIMEMTRMLFLEVPLAEPCQSRALHVL